MKRLLLSILVVCFLLLAACSTPSNTTTTSSPITTSTATTTTTIPITTAISTTTSTITPTVAVSPITTTATTTTPIPTTAMLPISIKIGAIASTWRDGEEPYDIYAAIGEILASTGIKVVSEVDEPYDALLFVEYEETKGINFNNTDFGTDIDCSLELRDKIGNLLFRININGGTKVSSAGLLLLYENETLYSKAIDDFKDEVYLEYLGQIIATGFGFGDVVPALTPSLDDEDSIVRANAESALHWINNCRFVDDLILDLKDKNEKTRLFAVFDLRDIGDIRAVEPLIQVLLDDESWSVRMNVAIALGELRDDSAVEALTQAMEDDEDPRVKYEATQALKKIQGE